MKTMRHTLIAILTALLITSCAETSSPGTILVPTTAQADRGFRMVLDKSLWGEPSPWSYCDQVGGLIPRAMMELKRQQPKLTDCYAIQGDKPLLGKATLAALEAKYGPADRVTRDSGFKVHYYGWFGFGTKDGDKSLGYLNAPMIFYVNGIEKSARERLKR